MAKILIIDDEQPVREAVCAVIEAAGHQTCAAPDGRRALEQVSTFRPDLVITDILMPGMEGMETIRNLRKVRLDLPIIAMSSSSRFGGMDYLMLAERMGADHSLAKPVSPRALLDAVLSRLLASLEMAAPS